VLRLAQSAGDRESRVVGKPEIKRCAISTQLDVEIVISITACVAVTTCRCPAALPPGRDAPNGLRASLELSEALVRGMLPPHAACVTRADR
jgi:hypothetical protein